MKITLIIFPGLKCLAEEQFPEDCLERQESDRHAGAVARAEAASLGRSDTVWPWFATCRPAVGVFAARGDLQCDRKKFDYSV